MKMIIFYYSIISSAWPKLRLQGVRRLDQGIRLSCNNPRQRRNRIHTLLQVPKKKYCTLNKHFKLKNKLFREKGNFKFKSSSTFFTRVVF